MDALFQAKVEIDELRKKKEVKRKSFFFDRLFAALLSEPLSFVLLTANTMAHISVCWCAVSTWASKRTTALGTWICG